jgi:hypothetical protein
MRHGYSPQIIPDKYRKYRPARDGLETPPSRLVYILRQPLEDLVASPVMKSLVWVICALEEHKGNGFSEDDLEGPWYGNPPRPPS